jgi:hypothetical protein
MAYLFVLLGANKYKNMGCSKINEELQTWNNLTT